MSFATVTLPSVFVRISEIVKAKFWIMMGSCRNRLDVDDVLCSYKDLLSVVRHTRFGVDVFGHAKYRVVPLYLSLALPVPKDEGNFHRLRVCSISYQLKLLRFKIGGTFSVVKLQG